MAVTYARHGCDVYTDLRWPVLRLAAKRRDGWKCVACASRARLQVDHVLPVRTHRELAFELTNLQTLCGTCHGAKTRREVGMPELSPERQKWRDLVRETHRNPSSKKENPCLIL